MNTKRVICKDTEEKLEELVVDFARKNGLTVTNINECMEKVKEYMYDNAVLENVDSGGQQSCSEEAFIAAAEWIRKEVV